MEGVYRRKVKCGPKLSRAKSQRFFEGNPNVDELKEHLKVSRLLRWT
jgi:hypothetical protein